jgi:hypothetical protein
MCRLGTARHGLSWLDSAQLGSVTETSVTALTQSCLSNKLAKRVETACKGKRCSDDMRE